MASFSWLRRRPRALAAVGVLTALTVTVTTLAFVYQGKPTTEVALNDGGVWVTKKSALLVGHFNKQSAVIDGGLRAGSDSYDIAQQGSTVLVADTQKSTVAIVDPARVAMTDSAQVPGGARTALGGGRVSIVDPGDGTTWVVDATALGSFSPATTEPVGRYGKDAVTAAASDGTVFVVSPATKKLTTIGRADDQSPVVTATRDLPDIGGSDGLQIAAVGRVAYVLDRSSGTLYGSDGMRAIVPDGRDAVLQQSSADNDAVTVATASQLVRVPRAGGDPVTLSSGAQGVAAAPVWVAGCAYGAWSGSNAFVRDCPIASDDLVSKLPGSAPNASLQFRTNRDVVVLNDVLSGAAWMASESLQRIDDWSAVVPPEGDSDEQDDTTEETVQTTLPDRTEENHPPVAVDDSFGVRPGRTTILPVLDNDSDPDGDVLVATVEGAGPGLGPIQQVRSGAALQIAVPDSASGSDSFRYTADDGRGGTASASVALSVHPWDVNEAPKQNRISTVQVESGGTVTTNVLPDWIDPDGDDIFLKSVTPADGDEADFTSDGRISYRAVGPTQGRKDVQIVVSDGTKDTAGTIRVDVRPTGSTVPVTQADHVVVRAGQPVTVSPLTNDSSASAEPLRLTNVSGPSTVSITPDYPGKSFTFLSNAPGSYYVSYLATAGPNSTPGVVRVDVMPADQSDAAPVAVRDVALLPRGGEVLVNVLGNDTDPAGGVLVVQSVSVEPGTGISASVLGHESVRISDQSALERQVRIGYRISNGQKSADGEIIVIPVPAPQVLRPPVANDDTAVVRAGDVVTIPVLDNDYSPSGSKLHIVPQLVAPLPDPADGDAFVSEDTLRFRAGSTPKTVYATYEVEDEQGQRDAGYVTIQILPVDADNNTAPRPRDLEARTVSGTQVRIAVPLDGIDQEGDSVQLVGPDSAPSKGRIAEVGSNYLVYEAYADAAGLDSFQYRVRDRLGKEAVAQVRVGIAPPESTNHAPFAQRDSVVMRPGRVVALPVLANDSDPDGDAISLVADGLTVAAVPGLKAEVSGDRVVITAPDTPVETSVQYTIVDARGLTASATVQVSVRADVPLLAPIARDDRVLGSEVDESGVATVDVLANDDDPDGTIADLTLGLGAGSEGSSITSDRKVRVPVGDTDRIITYTITDQDGQVASAFIFVPARGQLAPTLAKTQPVTVKSGETIELSLSEYVRAASGKKAVITEAGKVVAGHASGASLVKDQTTLVYTSAAGYFGSDGLTFEVTDGTGPDDPAGRKATLTIPITVLPPDNQPPTFAGASVNVAPGEDATKVDLKALSTDPDPGDIDKLTYRLSGDVPAGLSASVDGATLSVSAQTSARKGTVANLRIEVSDGQAPPVAGTINATVTASTRPLAAANDDVIAQAAQGKGIDVPVLDNDVNPFPDKPLKLVAATTETGEALAEVQGDRVRVTPGANFVGQVVVRYRIQDATADPDREVEGHIRITVQGKPAAPGTPTVSSVQDRTVVMSWTPPVDNGASITGYTVRSVAGGYVKQCASTTCTLDGLTNNVEYNFTVTATNRVGESDPSSPSQTARPDARPDTPQPPRLVFGDRSLSVTWVTPPTPGSPVENFDLEISPAPPSGAVQKTGVTGNQLVWEGLENGTAYQVRVRAHNRAPEPSSWSTWSATEIPARAPEAPAAPTTQRLDPVGDQAQIQVSWNAPAANGDPISGYTLLVKQGGSVVRTISVGAGTTRQAVTLPTSTTEYTFSVAASNKAGQGAFSPDSSPRRAFTAPDAPSQVSATPGNNTVTVTYTKGKTNGANANEVRYQYSVNNAAWRSDWDGMTIGNGQVNNNRTYSIRVRATTTLDGTTYDSAASAASNAVQPFGPVLTPGAGAGADGTNITFSWSAPARNGRDIARMDISIDGGGWQNVAASGSMTRGYDYSQTGTVRVRATDSEGQTAEASASARTVDRPAPRLTVSRGGGAVGMPGCSDPACAYLQVNTQNFPGGSYRYGCYDAEGQFNNWEGPIDFPANGSVQLQCYHGTAGSEVWVNLRGYGDSEHTSW